MSQIPRTDLRALCEARIHALQLSDRFDIDALRDVLTRSRGRPIELVAMNTGAGPWGLWVETDAADYIAYERDTSPTHQRHIVAHELAHIACGHRSGLNREDLVLLLLPSVQPETVRSVLGRQVFSAEEEREAELFASLLLQETSSTFRYSASEAAVARFEALLSGVEAARP